MFNYFVSARSQCFTIRSCPHSTAFLGNPKHCSFLNLSFLAYCSTFQCGTARRIFTLDKVFRKWWWGSEQVIAYLFCSKWPISQYSKWSNRNNRRWIGNKSWKTKNSTAYSPFFLVGYCSILPCLFLSSSDEVRINLKTVTSIKYKRCNIHQDKFDFSDRVNPCNL